MNKHVSGSESCYGEKCSRLKENVAILYRVIWESLSSKGTIKQRLKGKDVVGRDRRWCIHNSATDWVT